MVVVSVRWLYWMCWILEGKLTRQGIIKFIKYSYGIFTNGHWLSISLSGIVHIIRRRSNASQHIHKVCAATHTAVQQWHRWQQGLAVWHWHWKKDATTRHVALAPVLLPMHSLGAISATAASDMGFCFWLHFCSAMVNNSMTLLDSTRLYPVCPVCHAR